MRVHRSIALVGSAKREMRLDLVETVITVAKQRDFDTFPLKESVLKLFGISRQSFTVIRSPPSPDEIRFGMVQHRVFVIDRISRGTIRLPQHLLDYHETEMVQKMA